MPTIDQARNLANWAAEFGPGGTFWAGRTDGLSRCREIEFGNETSYGYQYGDNWDSASYSARAQDVRAALQGRADRDPGREPDVGLLGQIDDANTGGQNWVSGMFRPCRTSARASPAGRSIRTAARNWETRIDSTISSTTARRRGADDPDLGHRVGPRDRQRPLPVRQLQLGQVHDLRDGRRRR